MCTAVCDAGGLGFAAGGYLAAGELAARVRAVGDRRFGVNLFVPGAVAAVDVAPYVARRGPGAGEPRWDDDGWEAKLAL
ncbi:MAG: nitronate monooxygenase, partial [Actinomycetota bacterium]|nr:nitronate monooxygenase [Actinomycetota bacterium]